MAPTPGAVMNMRATGWTLAMASNCRREQVLGDIGVENVNSDFATFIRTIIILLALGAFGTGQWQPPGSVSGRSYLFLVLSGLATGGSWSATSAR